MKLTKLFAAMAVVMLTASCGVAGGASGSSVGSTNGQASGAALKNLYSQYKTDGKVDVSNINNIINIVSLVNGIQGLKGVDDKSAFYKDFAAGLILGSDNLINRSTSSMVTGALSSLAGNNLSALTSAAVNSALNSAVSSGTVQNAASSASSALNTITETTQGVTNTLSTLNTIFGMLK
ncbi:MAG: hypothetical protein J5732_07120 [Bacteroidaceae bacterium]|nr:hypothetical protein [Bacteroidaceae bacterium]